MSRLMKFVSLSWIWDNPVVIKEMRLKMRGGRPFFMLIIYSLVMIAISALMISSMTNNLANDFSMGGSLGTIIFVVLSTFQMLIIIFIIPGLTAGSISREKEQQTFNILLTTALSPWEIISGKLVSSIAYMLLMFIVTLPIMSMVFFFGGISPVDLIKVFFVIFTVLVTYASIGVFFSNVYRKTQTAIVVTYLFILFFMFGTLIASGIAYSYISLVRPESPDFIGQGLPPGAEPALNKRPQIKESPTEKFILDNIPKAILYLNPFVAVGSVLGRQQFFMGQPGPGSMMPFFGIDAPGGGKPIMAWKYMVLAYTFLTSFLLFVSTKIVKSNITLVTVLLSVYKLINRKKLKQ